LELELSAQNNSTEILNHVRALYEDTSPTISAAFAKQMKDDMPKITAMLGAERETLAINLKDRMDGLVRGHYDRAIDLHRGILVETFPSVKDDRDIEAMSDNFKDAFKPLVKQHYGDKIQAEFEKMFKTWDTFPQDESKRSREELSQELYNLLFALMQEKLAAASEERASAKPAPGASGS
jgi:hypothetical protein